MGMLTSDFDHSGLQVGAITLGEPARAIGADGVTTGPYRWDDGTLPNGVIAEDGTITLTDWEL